LFGYDRLRAIEQRSFAMFIAMNRFKVMKGAEQDFEQLWLSR
jgi:hypothetical protein